MTYAEFQRDWEHAADSEYTSYSRRPVAELIADARAGRYGEYYQLWRVIAARATLATAGDVLLEILRRHEPYLVRYHAAAALLALLGPVPFEPVELSARPDRVARIDAVEKMVRERSGSSGADQAD